MQKQLSTVGADHILNIEAGGSPFSLVSEDQALLSEFHSYRLNDGPVISDLLGFKISKSREGVALWTLVGMDGAVLARSRSEHDVVEVLRRHLDALAIVVRGNAVTRLALRAVIRADGDAVLVDPRLLRSQPVVERAFTKAGLAVADALFVDVEPETMTLAANDGALRSGIHVDGHVDYRALRSTRVRGIAWPAHPGAPDPTPGQTVHAIASALRFGSRQERLDTALNLSGAVDVRLVSQYEKGALLNVLDSQLA